MLGMPDFYKQIDEIARQKTLYDIEHDLVSDYSKIDLQHTEKISKQKCLSIIEKLLNNWPINTNYEKSQDILEDYTKKYINENFSLMNPATMFNILDNYKRNELLNMINPPIQAFVLYVKLLEFLYFYVQEKYIKKSKNDLPLMLSHNFIQYSLELLNSINALLLGSSNNSVIAVYRTFYENYIVFAYIQKHNELVEPFIDNVKMTELSLKLEVAKINNDDSVDEISAAINELKNKHDEHFDEDYGWTYKVITERKKRKLVTLFDESNLGQTFNFYYKLACVYTHSSSFSLLVRPEFKDLYKFLYGIVEIVLKEFEEMFTKLKVKSTKENELLKMWLQVSSSNLIKELDNWYNI